MWYIIAHAKITYQLLKKKKKQVRNKYTEGQLYFLFIGPIHLRKNLNNAIKAFSIYKRYFNDKSKLVVTGSHMWRSLGNTKQFEINDDVVFTGYLSNHELYKVTSAAICLLYVSYYEGFGMPILEAMSCNVPVITSNRSAMPEVAGDAAIVINPENIDAIADAMINIRENSKAKDNMLIKVQINLKRFSWELSSNHFWNSILKTIQ